MYAIRSYYGHLEELLRGAEGIRREKHEPRVANATRRRDAAGEHLARGLREAQRGEGTRAIEPVDGLDARALV